MYYQQGDYYRGDYYRGDPGIFGFLGNVARTVGRIGIGAATGFLTGGGIKGAIVGAAGGAGESVVRESSRAVVEAGGGESAYTPAMKAQHAEILARGGAGKIMRGGLANQGVMGPPIAGVYGIRQRRMHLNKSTYYRRGGGTQQMPPGLVLKGTSLVPSRRMNVGNARALRRAIVRLSGFGKLVHRMKRAVGRANTAVGNVHRARKAARRR